MYGAEKLPYNLIHYLIPTVPHKDTSPIANDLTVDGKSSESYTYTTVQTKQIVNLST